MSSFKLHCTYGLLIVSVLVLWVYQSPSSFQSGPPGRINDLHDLAFRLRQSGLDLRGVSPREDGLWLNPVYLTNTEYGVAELKKLTVNPKAVERWKGTVIVFSDETIDTTDWGENGFDWGPFVFFGDKNILLEIARALETSRLCVIRSARNGLYRIFLDGGY
jgi:hypothetical protein